MSQFTAGQKWISKAEPELGMGRIVDVSGRQLQVDYPLHEEQRTYTQDNAPLGRVIFHRGDEVRFKNAMRFKIKSTREVHGLVYYESHEGVSICETELSDEMRFSAPRERLFSGQFDDDAWFQLRYETQLHQGRLDQSPARGLLGPRVSLIAHQIFVSHEVATRHAPRVLLADEVGLGKTIEAGLIIHQQIHQGRTERVLIIVPSALVFQWFVEMARRFNFQFAIFDEDRCQQIEQSEQTGNDPMAHAVNPFESHQLVLCSLELFKENPQRIDQAIHGEWDMLVVDEAHHLVWSEDSSGDDYRIVELIAQRCDAVLLLTATPEQLGKAGHFARLRLLDPDRFHDYQSFLEEEKNYLPVVEQVNRMLSTDPHEADAIRHTLAETLGMDEADTNDHLISALIDQHGTGRVLFRNVRAAVPGFPERELISYPLARSADYNMRADDDLLLLYPEIFWRLQIDHEDWRSLDPRCRWLPPLLASLQSQKCLLICASMQTAIDLEEWLRQKHGYRTTVFHEEMDLISRDRAAGYFAETESGAQVMVCSEIGSEGRNFQFAHHLILFDLPANPDLLEQRIGRLDRIGQSETVHIHVPYTIGDASELLFRWYHEGLDVFRTSNPASHGIYEEQLKYWLDLLHRTGIEGQIPASFETFLDETRSLNRLRQDQLAGGRDRLLELSSQNPRQSEILIREIELLQGGDKLSSYMDRVFERYGLETDPLDDKVQLVRPTEGMDRHYVTSIETMERNRFPELPDGGIRISFDRATALAREDVQFITWESPMVAQAMELITSDIQGNCSVSVIKHPAFKRGSLLLETLYQFETVAPRHLQLNRYLQGRAIRKLLLANGTDLTDRVSHLDLRGETLAMDRGAIGRMVQGQYDLLQDLLTRSDRLVEEAADQIKARATLDMHTQIDAERSRLEHLALNNPNIRSQEIEYFGLLEAALDQYIEEAEVRLDALRVIVTA